MRRFVLWAFLDTVCALAALWVAFAIASHAPVAEAFTPWNVANWPGTTPADSPMIRKVSATGGLITWQAIDNYGWNGFRDVVSKSLDTGSSDPNSEGNVLNRFLAADGRGKITIREAKDGEVPDIQHYAVSTAFADAKCSTWGTACVYLLNALPVPAYYRASSMITWQYNSQAATVRHENFHAIGRACDEYRGGCPRASDGVWESATICTGNPDTLMDCGGAAITVTPFDYQTFLTAYDPGTGFLQVQPPCSSDPCFDNATGRWRFLSGWSYAPATDLWFDPKDRLFWEARASWGGRHSPVMSVWLPSGAPYWQDDIKDWKLVP